MSHTILLKGWREETRWKTGSTTSSGDEHADIERRLEFQRLLADNPDNPSGLLALSNEYQKVERFEDEAAVLERYVASHPDDEGNAYARLGDALSHLGRKDDARAAYDKGIQQA